MSLASTGIGTTTAGVTTDETHAVTTDENLAVTTGETTVAPIDGTTTTVAGAATTEAVDTTATGDTATTATLRRGLPNPEHSRPQPSVGLTFVALCWQSRQGSRG